MQKRLSMRRLKEIARLRFEAGRTYTEIASAVGVARSTVQTALSRLLASDLSWPWPWPLACDERELEARLYPTKPGPQQTVFSLPDFAKLRSE